MSRSIDRLLARFCALSPIFLWCGPAFAGFFVGQGNAGGPMGGNDTQAFVEATIDAYNASNDPDLIDPVARLSKTDDGGFAFDGSNGFMFFSDSLGTTMVNSASELHSLSEAYFKYTGPDNLILYSVKGPASHGFSLYTFMTGLNLLDLSGDSRDISHVSFWGGPPGLDPFGNPNVPEPSMLVLAALAGVALYPALRR